MILQFGELMPLDYDRARPPPLLARPRLAATMATG